MEMEATVTGAAAGADAGAVNFDAVLDGASPESVIEQHEKATTATPEPIAETPKVEEPTTPETTETAEAKPDQTTEQDETEPLPQKIEDLLRAVRQANPKLGAELNRVVREDHFLLHGPTGFLTAFPGGINEASEYKSVAPTVDDLKAMAEYSQRYDYVDKQYANDPAGLIRTLAEIPEEFTKVAEAFEPTLRALGNPQMYEAAAKSFNVNFWRNLTAAVEQQGSPEEVELFKAVGQKFLGPMVQQQPWQGQGQAAQPQGELQQLRAEREQFQHQRQEAFFNDAKATWTDLVKADMRKHLEQTMGTVIPKDIRDDVIADAIREASPAIWKVIDGNEMVKGRLADLINSGDQSPQHKKAVVDAVLAYAKPQIQTATAPVIRKHMSRARAYGGNTNATKATTSTASKDVGSGSPPVGGQQGAPKGFPAGWNAMNPETRSKFINWRAMGDDGDMLVIQAHQSGDWSKVVLKGK
jgi:hypothetical protein